MPSPRPVLVFDGDCGVCTRLADLARRWVRRSPGDFTVAPWQELDLPAYGLTPQRCDEALQWVDSTNRVYAAQDAVARVLLAGRWPARPLGAAILVPGVNTIAAHAYRWVAANRHRLPGGTPACSLPGPQSR